MNFKKGKNTIKPRTLRKLTKAIPCTAIQENEDLKMMLKRNAASAEHG